MQYAIKNIVMVMVLMMLLPGCARIIDWGKSQFNQGDELNVNAEKVRTYIRSLKIYDQMSTAGIFDVLWLSDTVRTEYAHVHAYKEGRDHDRTTAFLRRQLEENRHYISFYVLVPYYIKLGSMIDDNWSLFLKIDDYVVHPVECKTVELSPEYQLFFCKRFNRFKTAYSVKFDAKDRDKNNIITPATQVMTLCFRSTNKQANLVWLLHQGDLADHHATQDQRECRDA